MAEFVTRANRGMRIGNFELDFDDGEIRYKTSMDVEGGDLTDKMIDNLLRANLTTTDRYFTGLYWSCYLRRKAAVRRSSRKSGHPPGGMDALDATRAGSTTMKMRKCRSRPDEDEDEEDGGKRF